MTTERVAASSVVQTLEHESQPFGDFVFWLASIADDITPWGGGASSFAVRNKQLRQFWMQEPMLASALYTITIRDAAFSWTIKGDQPLTVKATQDMLHNANLGKGWLDFIQKWRLDLLSQDNGAFFEIIRSGPNATSPVIGINHLDSARCRRTGVQEWPVIYTDIHGVDHKMAPWQIVAISDFPSPVETANGMGFCAVSRILRHAQFMRDIGIRDRERSSGADPKTMHIISGVTQADISSAINEHKSTQLENGFVRHMKPVILSNVDPAVPAAVETLDLAPRPDQWDPKQVQESYLILLAMALGVDYQDLAPLPAKGIGSSAQSLILHEKSRGKGPEMFQKTVEHTFNFKGVIPQNVEFSYDEKDPAAEAENAELLDKKASAHQKFIAAGILTEQASRNMLLDDGTISQEVFDLASQNGEDVTDEVSASDDDRSLQQPGSQSADIRQAEDEKRRKENLSNFGEDERKKWQATLDRDMAKALNDVFKRLKKSILARKAMGVDRYLDYVVEQVEVFINYEAIAEKADPGKVTRGSRFLKDFRTTMGAAMAPNATRIFTGTAKFNLSVGVDVDMAIINESVAQFTKQYTTTWLAELEATTRTNLRKAIVDWQQTGLGRQGLPSLIEQIEPIFGKTRATLIAETETTRVFDLGNKASHKSAGIKEEEWQTAMDDLVRPEHRAFQGKRFPIDSGPRPSDFFRCRCARVPVGVNKR